MCVCDDNHFLRSPDVLLASKIEHPHLPRYAQYINVNTQLKRVYAFAFKLKNIMQWHLDETFRTTTDTYT